MGGRVGKVLNSFKRLRIVEHVRDALGHDRVPERRACRRLGQSRSTQLRQTYVPEDEPRLVRRVTEVAMSYGRYGTENWVTRLPNVELFDTLLTAHWRRYCSVVRPHSSSNYRPPAAAAVLSVKYFEPDLSWITAPSVSARQSSMFIRISAVVRGDAPLDCSSCVPVPASFVG